MVKQKRRFQKRAALILSLTLSSFLLLAGCTAKKDLPFYQLEVSPKFVLTVDGVPYIETTNIIRSHSSATGLFWKFTGKIGEAVGICGGDNAEQGGGYDVCQIEGDEELCFLYVRPNHFVFGPYNTYFFAREDLQLTLPSAEMISSVAVVYENEESASAQVDDPAMIAALLEIFHGDSIQAPDGRDWARASLIMHHKDFPFLQCEIKCYYSLEEELSYCKNENRECFVLPPEWFAAISDHDFSAKTAPGFTKPTETAIWHDKKYKNLSQK